MYLSSRAFPRLHPEEKAPVEDGIRKMMVSTLGFRKAPYRRYA
jgi:hypothetical protein